MASNHKQAILRAADTGSSDDSELEQSAEAIRACLAYLDGEAQKLGLALTAHFIGVAEASIPRSRRGGAKHGH